MDYLCSDEGRRKPYFTLYRSAHKVHECDTTAEVHEYVKANPDGSYTVYPGEGISLDGPECRDLRENWRR